MQEKKLKKKQVLKNKVRHARKILPQGHLHKKKLAVKDRTLNIVKFTELSRNKLDKTHQQQMHKLFMASSCMANVYLSKTVRKNYNKMTITSY